MKYLPLYLLLSANVACVAMDDSPSQNALSPVNIEFDKVTKEDESTDNQRSGTPPLFPAQVTNSAYVNKVDEDFVSRKKAELEKIRMALSEQKKNTEALTDVTTDNQLIFELKKLKLEKYRITMHHISSLVVSPDKQRKELGLKLMEEMISKNKSKN